MGQEFYCDLCRKSLPTADALNSVVIGDKRLADVCLTCGSAIGTGISRQIAEAAAVMQAAVNQQAVPPAPEVPPKTPPKAPPEVPPQAAQEPPK